MVHSHTRSSIGIHDEDRSGKCRDDCPLCRVDYLKVVEVVEVEGKKKKRAKGVEDEGI